MAGRNRCMRIAPDPGTGTSSVSSLWMIIYRNSGAMCVWKSRTLRNTGVS